MRPVTRDIRVTLKRTTVRIRFLGRTCYRASTFPPACAAASTAAHLCLSGTVFLSPLTVLLELVPHTVNRVAYRTFGHTFSPPSFLAILLSFPAYNSATSGGPTTRLVSCLGLLHLTTRLDSALLPRVARTSPTSRYGCCRAAYRHLRCFGGSLLGSTHFLVLCSHKELSAP